MQDSLLSPSINRICNITVLLPNDYHKSKERYITLYLLHGFNGNHSNWFTSTRLIQVAKAYKYIIISFDADNSWYTNSVTRQNAQYENLLMQDIIPFIDKKYRTKGDKAHRAIAGLSMGGYGAVKFGLKYPDKFFYAAGISSAIQFPAGLEDSAIVARRSAASNKSVREAFGPLRNEQWNENDIFYLVKNADVKMLPYFYLSVGSQDGIPEIIERTHQLSALFREKVIPFEMHESKGAHEWNYWDSEIENILQNISKQ